MFFNNTNLIKYLLEVHSKKYNSLVFSLMTIMLALILPLLIIYYYGDKVNSLSGSWRTPLQPIFIFSNLMTSFVLFRVSKWELSAMALFLLTIFSIDQYLILHNIFATMFFLFNIYPLLSLRKYNFFIFPYLLAVFWAPNLLLFETHSIIVLCVYHLTLLLKYNNILNKRKFFNN